MKEPMPVRPPSHYALIGGLIALGLECLVLPQLLMTGQVLGRIWPAPAPEALHVAQAAFRVLSIVVLLAQCAVAFWIARRTSPQWRWGLSPAIARATYTTIVFVLAALGVAPFREGLTGGAVATTMVLALGRSILAITFCAFMGSNIEQRRQLEEAEDREAAAWLAREGEAILAEERVSAEEAIALLDAEKIAPKDEGD